MGPFENQKLDYLGFRVYAIEGLKLVIQENNDWQGTERLGETESVYKTKNIPAFEEHIALIF